MSSEELLHTIRLLQQQLSGMEKILESEAGETPEQAPAAIGSLLDIVGQLQSFIVSSKLDQAALEERDKSLQTSTEAAYTRQLSALHTATSMLLSTLDLETLLGQIIDAATNAIPAAEKGILYLVSSSDSATARRIGGRSAPRRPSSSGGAGCETMRTHCMDDPHTPNAGVSTRPARPPNIVLVLADNLGWGDLGCYGGGELRGAPTPRIDALAREGLKFLNFNVESDCVPTRSALMTGRHPIRTGALQSVPAGLPQGIIPWEVTLAQLISGRGYATACFGKWHLGDREGRYPKDRGFDEWYGIPRTTNESMFTSSPGFDPDVVPMPYVMEGVKGKPAKNVCIYDLEVRRRIDSELTAKTIDFMTRQARAKKPFFAYVPLTQLHYPTLPHREFVGRTAQL